MPNKSYKMCNQIGCNNLTRSTYCTEHESLTNERRTIDKRRIDRTRDSSTKRGYGSRWRKRRAVYLADNPLCVDCKSVSIVTPATVVDHVEPHRGDYNLFWDESNWQALCATCHNIKTNRELAGRKGGGG